MQVPIVEFMPTPPPQERMTPIQVRRKKTTADQMIILESVFAETTRPNLVERQQIEQRTGISERSVRIWFRNRRAKTQTINRALAKENQHHQMEQPLYPIMYPPPYLMPLNTNVSAYPLMPHAYTSHDAMGYGYGFFQPIYPPNARRATMPNITDHAPFNPYTDHSLSPAGLVMNASNQNFNHERRLSVNLMNELPLKSPLHLHSPILERVMSQSNGSLDSIVAFLGSNESIQELVENNGMELLHEGMPSDSLDCLDDMHL